MSRTPKVPFSTKLRRAYEGEKFNPNIHTTADQLFEAVMDYYGGETTKTEMQRVLMLAGFADTNHLYRIRERKREGYVEVERGSEIITRIDVFPHAYY